MRNFARGAQNGNDRAFKERIKRGENPQQIIALLKLTA
jgi:hypothetical protein